MTIYTPYLEWIHSQQAQLLEQTKNWASVNTYSWNIKGIEVLTQRVLQAFEPLGGECRQVKLPPQKILGEDQVFHPHPLAPALTISKRPHAPIQVVLGGHLDTVYPPTSPFQSVRESSPGVWVGPGITDMKGGIVILLTALEALERSPFAETIGWKVILNTDEEIGSPGSSPLFREAANRATCGLIFEPSFPDGAFVSGRMGSASFTLAVRGKAAHAGRDHTLGRSAVFALGRLIHKLDLLRGTPDLIINVADLRGEGPVNIIAPFASCRVNIRSKSLKTLEEAIQSLYQIGKESEEEGITIEIENNSLREPKRFEDKTKELFAAYSLCGRELDIPFEMRESGGVCDGNTLASAGLPTLDTAGVVGGALHTPEEYLICSSIVERARLAALFLLKLANQEIILKK